MSFWLSIDVVGAVVVVISPSSLLYLSGLIISELTQRTCPAYRWNENSARDSSSPVTLKKKEQYTTQVKRACCCCLRAPSWLQSAVQPPALQRLAVRAAASRPFLSNAAVRPPDPVPAAAVRPPDPSLRWPSARRIPFLRRLIAPLDYKDEVIL